MVYSKKKRPLRWALKILSFFVLVGIVSVTLVCFLQNGSLDTFLHQNSAQTAPNPITNYFTDDWEIQQRISDEPIQEFETRQEQPFVETAPSTPASASMALYEIPSEGMAEPTPAPASDITQDTGDLFNLNVIPILQNPELPNGCEATSISVILHFYGYSVNKCDMAYNYIPRNDFTQNNGVRYAPHPNTSYIGDPSTSKGFYCFSGPVVAGANQYLEEMGSSLRCDDISGASLELFDQYISQGSPVMVWITLDFGNTVNYSTYTWTLPTGETYTPYRNLHCVVISGYDDVFYYLCDPLNGNISVDKQTVFESYLALGSHAAVIT